MGSLTGIAQSQSQREANAAGISVTTSSPQAPIDINHASLNELMQIPGMTPIWAARIVRFRPYHAKKDLLDMGIVNSQVYDRIKNYVVAHRNQQ